MIDANKKNTIKEAVLESLSNGATITAACKAAGVGRTTFYKWIEEDVEFAEAVSHSENASIITVEDALFRNATLGGKGFGDTTAQIFFLCNRDPDRWQNVNKVQHEDLTKTPTDQLDQHIERLIKETGVTPSVS